VPVESSVELLESGSGPSRWRTRWAGLPRGGRLLVAALLVVALAGAGLGWLHDRSARLALEQRIALTTGLSISSSSTSPPGGEVGYYVVVRNEGSRRVSVTAVEAATERLRLRMRDAAARPVDPGAETAIPLSVVLSCVPDAGEKRLPAEISLRREDGGAVTRRVDLRPTAPLLDVVTTLCGVRPDLRDHEISGPVLRFEEPLDTAPN
jgi:hypothetical protein